MPRGPRGLRLNLRNVGRQNRYASVARGIAQGTAYAFRNRGAITSGTRTATQAARSLLSRSTGYLRRKFTSKPKTSRSTLRDTDRTQEDLGTGGELTKSHVTFGGRPRPVSIAKLVKSSRQTQILRYSAISPFMNTGTAPLNTCAVGTVLGAGASWLSNWYNTTPGIVSLPLHVYDLTCMNNVVNGSVLSASPGVFALQTTLTGSVSWLPLVGNQPSSGTSANWQYEDTATLGTNAGSQPLRETLMDWVQARMMCYGSAKMATEYTIEVIQLREDYLCPDIMSGTLPSTAGIDYKNAANQFWNSYVKSYCAHPVATTVPTNRKHYRVIKTIRFTLQPRLSNETDANVGHCKQLNIFFRTNRTCKYDWAEDTIDPNVESGATFPTQQGQLQLTVHPKARMYMTIRATNVTEIVSPAVPTTDYTPSYDLLLRKKYTTLQ